jgi:hypothetical protein
LPEFPSSSARPFPSFAPLKLLGDKILTESNSTPWHQDYNLVGGKLYLGMCACLVGLGPNGMSSWLEEPNGHVLLCGVTG